MQNYLAQRIRNPVVSDRVQQTAGNVYVSDLIKTLISLIFVVGALVFFFMFILGAIAWMQSGGDKQALEGARGRVVNAVIGMVLLISVFAIVKVVESVFGVSILVLDIPSLV